ncbi:MAG: carboxypeptidase regulatory-like domain-containing protein [Chloracidobacterium sp.]|nr:carboxypeptidase regulatory-like domain-containing protein [Chloracidobacterium sp.]
MKRDLRIILLSVIAVMMAVVAASAQETTGTLEIRVKDATGAVVPNVSIRITSTSGSFRRTGTTDDSGYLRVVQVPPGQYTVSADATAGFAEKRIEQITVALGQVTPVNLEMAVGTVSADVTVTADSMTGIDITGNNNEATFTSEVAELLPKGLNFSSIVKFAPAANTNAGRTGQYQIDGASASENVFVIDGQEVSDVLNGALLINSTLPFSLVEATQIKSSGYEAEFGGATGGVINVVTKSGGNDFHGEVGVTLRSSRFEPTPRSTLLFPNSLEYYPSRRSPSNETNPTFTALGPIWKNKVWFSIGYAPQIVTSNRELVFRDRDTRELVGMSEHYRFKQTNEKMFLRLDGQPFNKLHLTGTFQLNPVHYLGGIPGYASELLTGTGSPPVYSLPCQAGNPNLCGADYTNQTGGRLNSLNAMVSGSYLIGSNLVVSARKSHYYFNDRFGTYGLGNATTPRIFCDRSVGFPAPPPFPANFGCSAGGGNNVGAAASSSYDMNIRDQLDGDVTYSFGLAGRHELKGGFQNNKTRNNVLQENNDIINLKWGTLRVPQVPGGTETWLTSQTGVTMPAAPGATGFGKLTYYAVDADSLGVNRAIYVQDKWQPVSRLTLNLGLRGEREFVPAFYEGIRGIDFNWSSKLAPRLGAAFDVTGDGKTKVSGFYGLFYDRFKLTMSRRTFGGESYHFLYFDLFPTDTLATLNRASITGGMDFIRGSSCSANTGPIPGYGRVRCDQDTSDDNAADPNIDPNLKPFQQREVTFSIQRQLSKNYLFTARYSRKQVLHAVEDLAFPDPDDPGATACCNYWVTGNPGEGRAKEVADYFGFTSPKAQRQYDALELRLDRRYEDDYFFSANYTWSRLYGNYSGSASTDEEGRLEPNIERYFDSPGSGFRITGGPDNGRLATDVPHMLKVYGTYTLNWDKIGLWKSNSTDFQMFYTAASGTVLTSFAQLDTVEQTVLYGRGDLGRTPTFSQTDFAIRHSIKFGKDGRFNLKFDADVINLFNQSVVLSTGRSNLAPLYQRGNMISPQSFGALTPSLGLLTQAQYNTCQVCCRFQTLLGHRLSHSTGQWSTWNNQCRSPWRLSTPEPLL